ncbi:hypothetical protein BH11ARM1_BH11ARM1_15430 [soil metagenome]
MKYLNLRSIAALAFVTISGAAFSQNVLLVTSDTAPFIQDVRDRLIATNSITGVIDVFEAQNATPTVAQLSAYDAVLCWSNTSFYEPTALGDNLADYADAGGGVVMATFSHSYPYNLAGRFVYQNYDALSPGDVLTGHHYMSAFYAPYHPVAADVFQFDGGSSSYRADCVVNPTSHTVAIYDDGVPLAAYHDLANGTSTVGLNFYPASSKARSDFWDTKTSGDRLLTNAIHYVAKYPVFSNFDKPKYVVAGSPTTTFATWSKPTATDYDGTSLPVTGSQASGTYLPLGYTMVQATAVGAHHTFSGFFKVWVHFKWSELNPPLKVGTSTVSVGTVIPAYFTLLNKSEHMHSLHPTLYYTRTTDGIPHVAGTFSYNHATSRYETNWNTAGRQNGIYQLTVDLGDGPPYVQGKVKIVH